MAMLNNTPAVSYHFREATVVRVGRVIKDNLHGATRLSRHARHAPGNRY